MRLWFFPAGSPRSQGRRHPVRPVRPLLEPLEDRCLPSVDLMSANVSVSPSGANAPPLAVNAVASLSHDQIHMLQDQSQQQTAIAALRLEVEQVVLGILQQFAPQVPQFQPAIAFLRGAIPAQEAAVTTLQNQTNLLNQLDDLQDQSLMLNAVIQNAAALTPVLQQLGDAAAANALRNLVAADQAAAAALQPQIAAVEVEVSTFV